MRVALYQADKQHVRDFMHVVYAGVRKCGDDCVQIGAYDPIDTCSDVSLTWGIRRRDFLTSGPHFVYLDKPYSRERGLRRCAINAFEPTAYIGKQGLPADRRIGFGWHPKPWRNCGGKIIIAVSNDLDHEWRRLPPPEDYAELIISQLHGMTDREIVYRCKPNRAPPRLVRGATMSTTQSLAEELAGAHVLIAVGGGVTVGAVLEGIPVIALGDAPVRSICSTSLKDVENPRLASDEEVERVFNDLAYCQWSDEELGSGDAWSFIREQVKE